MSLRCPRHRLDMLETLKRRLMSIGIVSLFKQSASCFHYFEKVHDIQVARNKSELNFI